MMAKRSAVKTLLRPSQDDEGLSSDADNVRTGAGLKDDSDQLDGNGTGEITHLGSDLSEVRLPTSDLQASDPASNGTIAQRVRTTGLGRIPTRSNGAEKQDEETEVAPRTSLEVLRLRNAGRLGNDKLNRPSANVISPPYRNPAERGPATQRRMRGPHTARPDPYDIVDSPEKLVRQQKSKPLPFTQAISPLKRQKKAASKKQGLKSATTKHKALADVQAQVDAQLLGASTPQTGPNESASSPRRLRRQTESAAQAAAQAEPGADEGGSVQQGRYKDHFRDPPGSATQDTAALQDESADEPTDEDVEDDALRAQLDGELDKLGKQVGAGEQQATPEQEPPKTSDVPSEEIVEQQAAPQKAQPRLRGRPRKTAPAVTTKRLVTGVEIPAHEAEPRAQARTAVPNVSPQNSRPEPTARQLRIAGEAKRENAKRKSDTQAKALEDKQAEAAATARRKSAKLRQKQPTPDQDEYVPDQQHEVEHQAEAAGEDEGHEDVDQDEVEDRLAKSVGQPKRTLKIAKVRPNKVYSAVNDSSADCESSPERQSSPEEQPAPEKQPAAGKRRRDRVEERPSANESRKRQKRAMGAGTPSAGDAEEVTEDDQRRLYGQWPVLRKVYKAIKEFGVQNLEGEAQPQWQVKLRDDKIIAALNACNDVLVKVANGEDPAAELTDVAEQVDALHERTEDNKPDYNSKARIKIIYSHLFPQLVRMVWHLVHSYEGTDAGIAPGSSLTKGHLRLVKNVIKVIIDLGKGAQKYVRPDTHFRLVQPVNNGIVAPLKDVYIAFTKALLRLENAADYKRRRQLEAERSALDAQREEQEASQAEQVKRARKKWQQLHLERLYAEGGIMKKEKRDHLSCVPEPEREYDENGEPFERVEVFYPRVGPSPTAVKRARMLVWPLVHSNALADGLRQYQGLDVFEKIFRRYCSRGQLLNKYNVVEIVTCAADLKEWLQGRQRDQEGAVQEWVERIPVWTRGTPIGKENAGVAEGDGLEGREDES